MNNKNYSKWLWDLFCTASIIGIWPRFIEPKMLCLNQFTLPIRSLPKDLDGLKCLHFSDLHWRGHLSSTYLKKLVKKINAQQPDLIFFTGDFLIRSLIDDRAELIAFLNALESKKGSFAVFGNHDYSAYVTVNQEGDYDIDETTPNSLLKGFELLVSRIKISGKTTNRAKKVVLHEELIHLLQDTPFIPLHNSHFFVPVGKSGLNIVGLGEYSAGQCNPDKGFKGYQNEFPGIILSHNPDSFPMLLDRPGDLILAGHTHGGQINLPYVWKKFTHLEQFRYKRGLLQVHEKWTYISRGVGSLIPFRWFSPPEITLFTLTSDGKNGATHNPL